MALATSACKNAIKAILLGNMSSITPTQQQLDQADTMAGGIADAVTALIMSGTLNYTTGLTAGGDPVVGSMGSVTIT